MATPPPPLLLNGGTRATGDSWRRYRIGRAYRVLGTGLESDRLYNVLRKVLYLVGTERGRVLVNFRTRIRKDLNLISVFYETGKESAMACSREPSRHLPEVTSENHGKPKSPCPDREQNPYPFERTPRNGVALEPKISPSRPAEQCHRPARFPLAKIREWPGRELNPVRLAFSLSVRGIWPDVCVPTVFRLGLYSIALPGGRKCLEYSCSREWPPVMDKSNVLENCLFRNKIQRDETRRAKTLQSCEFFSLPEEPLLCEASFPYTLPPPLSLFCPSSASCVASSERKIEKKTGEDPPKEGTKKKPAGSAIRRHTYNGLYEQITSGQFYCPCKVSGAREIERERERSTRLFMIFCVLGSWVVWNSTRWPQRVTKLLASPSTHYSRKQGRGWRGWGSRRRDRGLPRSSGSFQTLSEPATSSGSHSLPGSRALSVPPPPHATVYTHATRAIVPSSGVLAASCGIVGDSPSVRRD
ncbi:hypothetical protein PR048_007798 [Dryococelus australis]|uniref:Uncharacterized protein n=1 Tax=Dryococelus australis TaxID=614101 RepID=A0ABQ9HVB7_9NEOP|nr:hypothetical protein PR048_007798 [Dryococelus australis]